MLWSNLAKRRRGGQMIKISSQIQLQINWHMKLLFFKLLMFKFIILSYTPFIFASDFYFERQRGWYWHEQSQTEDEAQEQPELQLAPQQQLQQIQQKFEDSKARAVLNPTLENVREFLKTQKEMVDKASEFSRVAELAILSDSSLTYEGVNSNNAANNIAYNLHKENTKQVVKDLGHDYGLLLFVKPDCQFSAEMKKVVEHIYIEHGFEFSEIEVMADTRNAELAARLGVERFPSVYAYNPEQDLMIPLSYGLISVAELEHNIAKITDYLHLIKEPNHD